MHGPYKFTHGGSQYMLPTIHTKVGTSKGTTRVCHKMALAQLCPLHLTRCILQEWTTERHKGAWSKAWSNSTKGLTNVTLKGKDCTLTWTPSPTLASTKCIRP
jgi:hypothetical protein